MKKCLQHICRSGTTLIAGTLLLCGLHAGQMPPADIPALDKRFSDAKFFTEELNLDFPGLAEVRKAVKAGDYAKAQAALGAYYRSREIPVWEGSKQGLGLTARERNRAIQNARDLLSHKTLARYWTGKYTINYMLEPMEDFFPRMYWWIGIANAYQATNEPEIARTWVSLLRNFIEQSPLPKDDKIHGYWEAMRIGIRLRSGWSLCFATFIDSPEFTDRDIVNFLKSVIEQVEFANRTHWPTGNKIAYTMTGVFAMGSAFPELTRAPAWREYAIDKSLGNLADGYLKDNMGIELSAGYHYAFKNFLTIVEIAKVTGQTSPHLQQLVDECEKLFTVTATLSLPNRNMPNYQDSGAIRLPEQFKLALNYYPDNPVFNWFATDGTEGTPPDYRSVALPYAGYIAMRTGWESDANYVGFDVGPIGFGHAHQDKLNLIMAAYGRYLLIDPGHGNYSGGDFSEWALDTFAHNTALVDNRPQRRRWGKSGGFMPDEQPLGDYSFETTETWDRASGIYDESYGPQGASQAYPYHTNSTFLKGWGKPATHNRRVFFLHPDVVLVADTMTPLDGKAHDYELRWTLDSTSVSGPRAGSDAVHTTDRGQPNLAVIPLDLPGLQTKIVSASTDPIIGWNFTAKEPKPATTVRHLKSGNGPVAFLTLLLPARANQTLGVSRIHRINEENLIIELSDGRRLKATIPANPAQPLFISTE